MVLSKRNANGEFVVWNASSQASSSNAPSFQDAPSSPKKPRLSTAQTSGYGSELAKSAYQDHFSSNLSASASSRVQTPRFQSPDVEVVSTTISMNPQNSRFNSSPAQIQTSSYAIPSTSTLIPIPAPAAPKRGRKRKASSPPASSPLPSTKPPQPSASTSYQASSSQPTASAPAKRGRKKATEGSAPAPKPEKRGAIFKKKCPQAILERVERVMTQRIFMIDRNRVDGELKEEFSVLGSTGNVYTVTIDHRPRCSCPDSSKGNHCKHILFIFLKVLQVTQASGYWYQKALLTTELEDIFAHAPLAPNSLAHPHIRDAYARVTGKAPSTAATTAAAAKKRRIPGPDDDCPICYDGMHGTAEAALVFCEDCGNALHKECFGQWQRTAASSGKDLTCVWCRAPWVLAPVAGAGAAAARRAEGGYLNLAGVGGVSPVRDTSTYYHGPRRGQRYYGYQAYGE